MIERNWNILNDDKKNFVKILCLKEIKRRYGDTTTTEEENDIDSNVSDATAKAFFESEKFLDTLNDEIYYYNNKIQELKNWINKYE